MRFLTAYCQQPSVLCLLVEQTEFVYTTQMFTTAVLP